MNLAVWWQNESSLQLRDFFLPERFLDLERLRARLALLDRLFERGFDWLLALAGLPSIFLSSAFLAALNASLSATYFLYVPVFWYFSTAFWYFALAAAALSSYGFFFAADSLP